MVLAENDTDVCKNSGVGRPGLVRVPVFEFGQFRYPVASVASLLVKLFSLQYRLEYAEEGCCIDTAACSPLPARGAVGEIGVNECIPEPACTFLSGDRQILVQQRSYDHAYAVMHVTGCP